VSERNRHGIPTYNPPAPPRCVMPKCREKPDPTWPDLSLCESHAFAVWRTTDFRYGYDARKRHEEELERARAEVTKPKRAIPTDGVVYYANVGGGHIKIGWTGDLTKRMRQYPPNTVLLAVHPGTRADERKLHKRFAVHRAFGTEWYPMVPVILDHIARVVAEHGQPPVVAFGAKPTKVPTPRRKQIVAMRSRSGASYARP
jgi:hypothetical protein